VEELSQQRLDELARARRWRGLASPDVVRLCDRLATMVERCQALPLPELRPGVCVDGAKVAVPAQQRVVSMAVVLAMSTDANGQRTLIHGDVGPSEDLAFWRAFLLRLVARGYSRGRVVSADGAVALPGAVATALRRAP
jgi:transposase-like protein